MSTSGNERGNFLGYATAIRAMGAALARYATLDPDAPAAIHLCHPFAFDPDPSRRVVFFTMFESTEVPVEFPIAFSRADLIVVPSKFCAEVFRPYTDKPIEVCPLGVDTSVYTYRKRRWPGPGERWRWLYVGAPNPRKWSILEDLYRVLIRRLPNTELYLKTTGADMAGVAKIPDAVVDGDVVRGDGGRFIVDNRFLSTAEMVALYHSAHGFLFPTVGEGWGMSALEAQATGLAPIVTAYSGVLEYATSENAYLIGYDRRVVPCEPLDGHGPDQDFTLALPRLEEAMGAIGEVVGNYHRAQQKGKQAHRDAQRFSWDSAARRLLQILAKHGILAPADRAVAA